MNIQRTFKRAPQPAEKQPAWIQPPNTLATPIVDPNIADPDFNTKYIAFAANAWKNQLPLPSQPVNWIPPMMVGVIPQVPTLALVHWNAGSPAGVVGFTDDECPGGACTNSYWNMQVEIVFGSGLGDRVYTNLQTEYR